jgi:hypothetical protein
MGMLCHGRIGVWHCGHWDGGHARFQPLPVGCRRVHQGKSMDNHIDKAANTATEDEEQGDGN